MVAYVVLLILSLNEIVFGHVNKKPLMPRKRCVATSVQHGPCHMCVCSTGGVYNCRALPCNESVIMQSTDANKMECEPRFTYRDNTTICSCNTTGYWPSPSCSIHFHQIHSKTNLRPLIIKTNIACKPNHYYALDCNICLCNQNGLIAIDLCTNRPCPSTHKGDICKSGEVLRTSKELCSCSDIDYYIDGLCVDVKNGILEEIQSADLDKIIDVGRNWHDLKTNCKPNSKYVIDCMKCECNKKGELSCDGMKCVHTKTDLRSKIKRNGIYALPKLNSSTEKCKPGVKYRYKCKTCVCNNIGNPICTSMLCVEDLTIDLDYLRLIVSKND